MPHRPFLPARARLSRSPLRTLRRLGVVAVASALLVTVAAPTQAAVTSTPVGNLDSVVATSGGVQVRGWAWDKDTTQALTVTVKAGSTTKTFTANASRPDVATVYPAAGSNRGFEGSFAVPAGTHQVCAIATNVGSGSNKDLGCRTVTVGSTSAAPAAPVASTGRKLSWAPPALSSPTTVNVSSTNGEVRLTAGKDYIVKMPSTPLTAKGGLQIYGGRNVVLIGGEVKIATGSSSGSDLRGLYLKAQTGTVHIEGLKITGAALAEGINVDERNGATVQFQNVRVDTVHGSASGHHADVLQVWAGPKALRVDGFTGYSTYQGFFLTPMQYGPAPSVVDLRNVNLVGQSGSKYLFWRDGSWPLKLQNVWAQTSQTGAPRHQYLRDNGTNPWAAVQSGKPASGDIVPAGLAGIGYRSPGYN